MNPVTPGVKPPSTPLEKKANILSPTSNNGNMSVLSSYDGGVTGVNASAKFLQSPHSPHNRSSSTTGTVTAATTDRKNKKINTSVLQQSLASPRVAASLLKPVQMSDLLHATIIGLAAPFLHYIAPASADESPSSSSTAHTTATITSPILTTATLTAGPSWLSSIPITATAKSSTPMAAASFRPKLSPIHESLIKQIVATSDTSKKNPASIPSRPIFGVRIDVLHGVVVAASNNSSSDSSKRRNGNSPPSKSYRVLASLLTHEPGAAAREGAADRPISPNNENASSSSCYHDATGTKAATPLRVGNDNAISFCSSIMWKQSLVLSNSSSSNNTSDNNSTNNNSSVGSFQPYVLRVKVVSDDDETSASNNNTAPTSSSSVLAMTDIDLSRVIASVNSNNGDADEASLIPPHPIRIRWSAAGVALDLLVEVLSNPNVTTNNDTLQQSNRNSSSQSSWIFRTDMQYMDEASSMVIPASLSWRRRRIERSKTGGSNGKQPPADDDDQYQQYQQQHGRSWPWKAFQHLNSNILTHLSKRSHLPGAGNTNNISTTTASAVSIYVSQVCLPSVLGLTSPPPPRFRVTASLLAHPHHHHHHHDTAFSSSDIPSSTDLETDYLHDATAAQAAIPLSHISRLEVGVVHFRETLLVSQKHHNSDGSGRSNDINETKNNGSSSSPIIIPLIVRLQLIAETPMSMHLDDNQTGFPPQKHKNSINGDVVVQQMKTTFAGVGRKLFASLAEEEDDEEEEEENQDDEQGVVGRRAWENNQNYPPPPSSSSPGHSRRHQKRRVQKVTFAPIASIDLDLTSSHAGNSFPLRLRWPSVSAAMDITVNVVATPNNTNTTYDTTDAPSSGSMLDSASGGIAFAHLAVDSVNIMCPAPASSPSSGITTTTPHSSSSSLAAADTTASMGSISSPTSTLMKWLDPTAPSLALLTTAADAYEAQILSQQERMKTIKDRGQGSFSSTSNVDTLTVAMRALPPGSTSAASGAVAFNIASAAGNATDDDAQAASIAAELPPLVVIVDTTRVVGGCGVLDVPGVVASALNFTTSSLETNDVGATTTGRSVGMAGGTDGSSFSPPLLSLQRNPQQPPQSTSNVVASGGGMNAVMMMASANNNNNSNSNNNTSTTSSMSNVSTAAVVGSVAYSGASGVSLTAAFPTAKCNALLASSPPPADLLVQVLSVIAGMPCGGSSATSGEYPGDVELKAFTSTAMNATNNATTNSTNNNNNNTDDIGVTTLAFLNADATTCAPIGVARIGRVLAAGVLPFPAISTAAATTTNTNTYTGASTQKVTIPLKSFPLVAPWDVPKLRFLQEATKGTSVSTENKKTIPASILAELDASLSIWVVTTVATTPSSPFLKYLVHTAAGIPEVIIASNNIAVKTANTTCERAKLVNLSLRPSSQKPPPSRAASISSVNINHSSDNDGDAELDDSASGATRSPGSRERLDRMLNDAAAGSAAAAFGLSASPRGNATPMEVKAGNYHQYNNNNSLRGGNTRQAPNANLQQNYGGKVGMNGIASSGDSNVVIQRLVGELDRRTDALRTCGEEIVTLRRALRLARDAVASAQQEATETEAARRASDDAILQASLRDMGAHALNASPNSPGFLTTTTAMSSASILSALQQADPTGSTVVPTLLRRLTVVAQRYVQQRAANSTLVSECYSLRARLRALENASINGGGSSTTTSTNNNQSKQQKSTQHHHPFGSLDGATVSRSVPLAETIATTTANALQGTIDAAPGTLESLTAHILAAESAMGLSLGGAVPGSLARAVTSRSNNHNNNNNGNNSFFSSIDESATTAASATATAALLAAGEGNSGPYTAALAAGGTFLDAAAPVSALSHAKLLDAYAAVVGDQERMRAQVAQAHARANEVSDAHKAALTMVQEYQLKNKGINTLKQTVVTQQNLIRKLEDALDSAMGKVSNAKRTEQLLRRDMEKQEIYARRGANPEYEGDITAHLRAKDARISILEEQLTASASAFAAELSSAQTRIVELEGLLQGKEADVARAREGAAVSGRFGSGANDRLKAGAPKRAALSANENENENDDDDDDGGGGDGNQQHKKQGKKKSGNDDDGDSSSKNNTGRERLPSLAAQLEGDLKAIDDMLAGLGLPDSGGTTANLNAGNGSRSRNPSRPSSRDSIHGLGVLLRESEKEEEEERGGYRGYRRSRGVGVESGVGGGGGGPGGSGSGSGSAKAGVWRNEV